MDKKEQIADSELKKEYLNQYRENKAAVERIEEQLRQFEIKELSPKISTMDVGPHGSRVIKDLSDYMVKKDELVSEMLRARYNRICKYQEIFEAIEEMANEQERRVLTLRYIKGMKWEKIAVEMHVEWAQVHRIHAKALRNFVIPIK